MEKYGYVFYVTHQYFVEIDADGDCVNEVKEIGVYSRKRLAEQAIRRFAGLPGFVKHPDGFTIAKQRCYLQHASRVSELRMVYAPYHEQYLPASDCDEVTRGAFFEAADEAEWVLQEWRKQPKFAGAEDGYAVMEYALDEDIRFWSEGFS